MRFRTLEVEVFLYFLLVSKMCNFSTKKTTSFLKNITFVDPNLLNLKGPNHLKMCCFRDVFKCVNKRMKQKIYLTCLVLWEWLLIKAWEQITDKVPYHASHLIFFFA